MLLGLGFMEAKGEAEATKKFLLGHTEQFAAAALHDKLLALEQALQPLSLLELIKETAQKAQQKATFAGDNMTEIGKRIGQSTAEIMATIKATPATIVQLKALTEKLNMTMDETLRLVNEVRAPVIERNSIGNDCQAILSKNREDFFPQMQAHVLALGSRLEALTATVKQLGESVRSLEQRLPDRPPYRVLPQVAMPAQSLAAQPPMFNIADHLGPHVEPYRTGAGTTSHPTAEMLLQQEIQLMQRRS